MNRTNDLLNGPLSDLPVSDELKSAARQNGFQTLLEISKFHMTELIVKPKFDHRIWNEYVEFLEANQLGYILNKKSPSQK